MAFQVGIVCSEWHKDLVEQLYKGALQELASQSVKALPPLWVPGSGEIPQASRWLIEKKKPSGLLALGVVILGETPHFMSLRWILDQGLMQLRERFSIPIVFAVLSVKSRLQAEERIGGGKGHRGSEAARALFKMMALKKRLFEEAGRP